MEKTLDQPDPNKSVSPELNTDRATDSNVQNGKTDFTKFNISWYNPGPRWKVILWFLVNAFFLNTYLPIPIALKVAVLRLFGAKIGEGVVIKPALNIKYPWLLTVGNQVWIGENVWIDNLSNVTIGNNVCLSQGAMLLTGNHDYSRSTFDLTTRPIILEDGVWIGAKAIVCAGVRCESHAVLAVNSVATHVLKAYGIYQGNPAVWVRQRNIKA
ncbi:WcaF family extracellular polysaccharide biosynthesis acetyltransferase [Spirosoma fluviale]|uniref:Putative colanic acid biosynthesis acetyltransferase WcaF n=1 Tax=Spirosoma fluviale TaxID=1597977 RepID=A0A286FJW0_9BACT|nr:WcaF family extracellular polysaccharide biosynthesis acetyltransferase [Spirosoma fluviale]SOD83259.1 putative colanic acid biosynthesis acetyltransferase WcaF [Spirosoma fluviale]